MILGIFRINFQIYLHNTSSNITQCSGMGKFIYYYHPTRQSNKVCTDELYCEP